MKVKSFHILCLFILGPFLVSLYFSLFHNDNSGLNLLKIQVENEPDVIYKIKIIFNTLRTLIFLLIPLVGLLFKNKIGWVLITQYFYFIAFNISKILIEGKYEFELSILSFIFIVIVVTIIYGLNRKTLYANHFKIKQQELIMLNSIALGVGLFLSIVVFVVKYNYWIK